MSRKKILLTVLCFMLFGAIMIVSYYWFQGKYYVRTEDARVAANIVFIAPEIVGRIVEWNVHEGDMVKAGDILGRQDLAATLTSGALNPQAITTVGGIIADKALFKAPLAGQVIQSNAVVGQMAAPGTSLTVIADVDNMYISANIKENELYKISIGNDVDIRVDAFPTQKFQGHVESIGRATVSTFSLLSLQNSGSNYTKVTQVIPIKIQLFDRANLPLMVGMNATIRIHASPIQ